MPDESACADRTLPTSLMRECRCNWGPYRIHTGSTAYACNSRMNWLMGSADALGGTCKGKCNRTVV